MSKKPTVDFTKPNDVFNTTWKERTSKKGNNYFYRKHNGRWVNVGRYKTGHVYVTVDSKYVENHDIHFTNNKQLLEDVDKMLETLVIIAD